MDGRYEPVCLAEDNLDSWYEPRCWEEHDHIVQLGQDYAKWFERFTLTKRGDDAVAEYNGAWRKMHNELFVFYRHEMLLESYAEEDEPLLKIDVSQRDNFKWQFHAWMTGIQDACPKPELYFGRYYGIKDLLRYKRFFFKHHWDPEKAVGDHWNPEKMESLMKKS